MPGVIDGKKYDEKFVEELTGFKLKPIDLKTAPQIASCGDMKEPAEMSLSKPLSCFDSYRWIS